jgi:methyl-accepting chemotaxis protein
VLDMIAPALAADGDPIFTSTSDIFKTAALFLAVLVPLVAAVWQARRETSKAASVSPAGMVAIGGALASEAASKLYIEEFQHLTTAINRMTVAYERGAQHTEEAADALKDTAARARATLDEAENMRRTLEEIATILRRGVDEMARRPHPPRAP